MTNAGDLTTDASVTVRVDVLIIGGGIAGLWTLARMQQAGYKTVLLESEALGAGQTRYAQGIIHGGTKYALTGKLTASSEAVADMPTRWRACYDGSGELDLSAAELLSDAHYLWSTKNLASRISGFFASKVMRARSTELDKKSLPSVFQHKDFKGQFYRLDEPVFNTLSVIRALVQPREASILMTEQAPLEACKNSLTVKSKDKKNYVFHFKKIIFMAGQGNQAMLSAYGFSKPEMQLRPLKMVVMRNKSNEKIFAHCLGASVNPRITITSHPDNKGNIVWYMGGQLAEEGVAKSDAELIKAAKKELNELIPWFDLKDSEWGVLAIDRAEIKKAGSTRPDSFSIETNENVITAWPTKMALSPAMADVLVGMISKDKIEAETDLSLPEWQQPVYADFPWNEKKIWSHNNQGGQ